MTGTTGTPPLNRRALLAGVTASLAASVAVPAAAQVSARTAWTFSFAGLDGGDIALAQFSGRPLLVVNTASFCGFASQLASLQTLHARLSPRGFVLLGVPSNDFGGQEPGPPSETRQIASSHGVTFPLAAKTRVVGPDAHPFYRWAAAERPRETPRWNFHKYSWAWTASSSPRFRRRPIRSTRGSRWRWNASSPVADRA